MSASRHRQKPRFKLELCVQPCVRAVRASLRSCTGAGHRPRRPAPTLRTAGRCSFDSQQKPPRGEAVRSYPTALFLVNQRVPVRTNALQHIKSMAASAMDPQAGRFNRTSSAAQATPGIRGSAQCTALTASHRAAWRQRWTECFELPPSILTHEGFSPAPPPCPESSRYSIE